MGSTERRSIRQNIQMQSFINAVKALVLLSPLALLLISCNRFQVSEITAPTPIGPITIKFDQARQVKDLSIEQLGSIPPGVTNGEIEPGEYRQFHNRKFAIWVPEGCTYDSASNLALDPGFTASFEREFQKVQRDIIRDYDQLPPRVSLTNLYLNSDSFQFKCGPTKRVTFTKGSRWGGWTVNEKMLGEYRALGNLSAEYPHREIQVTAVSKATFTTLGFTPSIANLLIWGNEFFPVHDHQRIFGDKGSVQLFALSQSNYENVEILNKTGRSVRFHSLTGMFEGSIFIYFVRVSAMEGETTEKQWITLQKSLESFRYE